MPNCVCLCVPRTSVKWSTQIAGLFVRRQLAEFHLPFPWDHEEEWVFWPCTVIANIIHLYQWNHLTCVTGLLSCSCQWALLFTRSGHLGSKRFKILHSAPPPSYCLTLHGGTNMAARWIFRPISSYTGAHYSHFNGLQDTGDRTHKRTRMIKTWRPVSKRAYATDSGVLIHLLSACRGRL